MNNITKNLHGHKARFLEIMECKDRITRSMRLEALETDMEFCYGIPRYGKLKIRAFRMSKDYAPVYKLYQEVKGAKWSE